MRKIIKLNNKEDFKAFVISCEDFTGCIEDYEELFGFQRKFDEETGKLLETIEEYFDRGGTFEHMPTKFPCYYIVGIYENGFDRVHKKDVYRIEDLDLCYPEEIRNILEVTDYDKKAWDFHCR